MIADVLFGALHLAHALAAALWVGGTLACLLTLAPGLIERAGWRAWRDALRVGIGVFVVTGAVMAVQRLSSATLPPLYFAVLVVKVGLGIWLFNLGRKIGVDSAVPSAWWQRPEMHVVGVGAVIYGLAIVLRTIYESALRS